MTYRPTLLALGLAVSVGGVAAAAPRNAGRRSAENTETAAAQPSKAELRADRRTVAEPGDAEARVAAIQRLVAAGDEDGADALIEAFCAEEATVRDAAAAALAEIPGGTPALVRFIEQKKTDPEARRRAIAVLGNRHEARATTALLKTAKDPDPATARAALVAIGEAGDPKAADPLLELLPRLAPALRGVGLRSYVLVARRLTDRDAALGAYSMALRLGPAEPERRLIFNGLVELASPDSLVLVEPFFAASGPLRDDAVRVAAAIAGRLAASGNKEAALALYRRLLSAASDAEMRLSLAKAIQSLGSSIDVGAEQGFLTRWWLLGPLASRGRWAKTDAVDPRAAVDPIRRVQVDGQGLTWRPLRSLDPAGAVDLGRETDGAQDAVVYLYTEVRSPRAQEVTLQIGSDDGFALWINGIRAVGFDGTRAYAPGATVARVWLDAGVNQLMWKLGHGGGSWLASLRVANAAGDPVRLAPVPLGGEGP